MGTQWDGARVRVGGGRCVCVCVSGGGGGAHCCEMSVPIYEYNTKMSQGEISLSRNSEDRGNVPKTLGNGFTHVMYLLILYFQKEVANQNDTSKLYQWTIQTTYSKSNWQLKPYVLPVGIYN